MTIAEMKERKRELGYTNKMISEKTGIPVSTLQKVFSGVTSSPRRETIVALERLLRPRSSSDDPAAARSSYSALPSPAAGSIRDAEPLYTYAPAGLYTYDRQGSYTLEDYLALPDEQRVELIDGVFYDMASPTTVHQAIAGYIFKIFLDHVLTNKGPCYPFISPVDVQLDRDDKTIVQPDVLIVCDRSKYKNNRVFGAPDLVIEVLSPSTRKKDMQIKMQKYGNAGVREYWMIDPKKKVLVQYDLEHMDIPKIFSFHDTVPVLIWGGACQVDLAAMYDAISFLWEEANEES
ncbi:MAG: Uma2 family endonuclease [Eubacterium sp.]|nr:Uma2 family endonuclease [Eubacterium sp.]